MKKILAVLLALAMIFCMAACGKTEAPAPAQTGDEAADSDLQYVLDKGVLVVGITDYEPADFKDANGEWIGFDADLAREFAEQLGVECEFQEIDWDNKILELQGKSIDCIWNAMTPTPELEAGTSLTIGYWENGQVLVVPKDKADEYVSADSVMGLNVAVEAGSSGEEVANELGLTTVPVNVQTAALMEVQAGTSDVAVIDLALSAALLGEGKTYEDLVAVTNLAKEVDVAAFRQGSELTEKCNEFLKAKYADGSLAELADSYEGVGAAVVQCVGEAQ